MDSIGVEWRDVKGLEGRFVVSNDGRVRRIQHEIEYAGAGGVVRRRTLCEKEMPQYAAGHGYRTWTGGQVMRYVHRTVAEAFIGDVGGMTINHKDFDKTNNRAENLEIVTHAENMQHATDGGRHRRGCRHGRAVYTESQIVRAVELIRGGATRKAASDLTGVKVDAIEQVLWGNNWSHLGLSERKSPA